MSEKCAPFSSRLIFLHSALQQDPSPPSFGLLSPSVCIVMDTVSTLWPPLSPLCFNRPPRAPNKKQQQSAHHGMPNPVTNTITHKGNLNKATFDHHDDADDDNNCALPPLNGDSCNDAGLAKKKKTNGNLGTFFAFHGVPNAVTNEATFNSSDDNDDCAPPLNGDSCCGAGLGQNNKMNGDGMAQLRSFFIFFMSVHHLMPMKSRTKLGLTIMMTKMRVPCPLLMEMVLIVLVLARMTRTMQMTFNNQFQFLFFKFLQLGFKALTVSFWFVPESSSLTRCLLIFIALRYNVAFPVL